MAIRVKIDFKNIYELDFVSSNRRFATFQTELKNGGSTRLTIKISEDSHELFENVYNLSFGPLRQGRRVDDKAEVPHLSHSKVFSTILLNAFNYLKVNPDHFLGIDASENRRAWYYWRFLQNNYDYLNQYFDIFGLKYYVRISRFGKYQYDNPFNFDDIQTIAEKILHTNTWPEQLYNYFIFARKRVLTTLHNLSVII